MRAEFDIHAESYEAAHRANVAITGEEPAYFAEYKIRVLAGLVRARGLDRGALLDFGAGLGASVAPIRRLLPGLALTCADVSRRSLAGLTERHPGTDTLPIDGRRIPSGDGRFDIAFSACVFHHIAPADHIGWLRELRRVVRPGGLLFVFEHNPLNPVTVRAVRTCPFDRNARLIRAGRLAAACRAAGWARARVRFHVFFPHALARLRPIEPYLEWLPLGAQYAVSADG